MLEKLTFSVIFSNSGGGGGGNMLCLTLPTFSLSYCKVLKGDPVEYLTCDFEAFNKTLHIAGITGDFEALVISYIRMASITCGFEAFNKKSHIRKVLLETLKLSVRR